MSARPILAAWRRAIAQRVIGAAVGSSLVALLLSAPALAGPTAGPLSQASATGSPFAGCTIGGPGTVFPNAEVEPFVAVNPANPNNMIGVYQQDRWSNSAARGLVSAFSFDGGNTWGNSFAHLSECAGGTPANGGDYPRSSDPWVSIGPDGRAYQVSISFTPDGRRSAVLASTSADGGQTWSDPYTVEKDVSSVPGVGFNDKESVTADPAKPGTAYLVWDHSQFPSDNANSTALQHSVAFRGVPFFSKTTDGGNAWSLPRQIASQSISSIGDQIVVEPDGTLIDVFHFGMGSGRDDPNASLQGFMRSTDGGNTWSPPKVISSNPVTTPVDPNNGLPLRTGSDIGGSFPDVAVDPSNGKLYVVWEDNRFSGGTHDDIAMATSTDEGKTWSQPVKVNQTPVSVPAFTPMVSVLPNGTVAVAYYDLRNDPGNPATLLTDYFIADSHNGGATFSEARITPTSFDDTFAPIARGYFLGDYQGLANDGKNFKALFIQTNRNTANPTDVFSVTVTP